MVTTTRSPLTREQIIRAAAAHADAHGVDDLSMRKLGADLGVEAMALYNHVENKDDIYDGMIDFVFAEIAIPEDGLGWKEHLHELGREAMVRFTQHPWVVMCMSRGTFSFGALQLMDHVLGVLHDAGFDDEESHHAWQLLASHTMGYAFQSSTGLGATNKDPSEFESQLTQIGRQFPNVARLAPQVIGCVWDTEFVFGLEIILDGLESRLG